VCLGLYQNDDEAHDRFLRINRAYEVLKDDNLRKKYDMYGEEGLKEDGPSGRGYKSWNFYYQDFGMSAVLELRLFVFQVRAVDWL